MSCGQRNGSPRTYSWFSRPEPILFHSSSPSILLTRLSGPCSRPTTLRKYGSVGNRIWDLWICSQELLTTRPKRRSKRILQARGWVSTDGSVATALLSTTPHPVIIHSLWIMLSDLYQFNTDFWNCESCTDNSQDSLHGAISTQKQF
jgi:hypothetical protein